MTPDDRLARIAELASEMVRRAPDHAGVAVAVLEELRRVDAPLARSIARVVELVIDQRIDPGVALPPLAMACATLADGARGELTERAIEAARFEIETLLPLPERPPPSPRPDVPVTALRKRPS